MIALLYFNTHFTKPVRFGPVPPLQDPQAALPPGWCPDCGREVYLPEEFYCASCRKYRTHKDQEETYEYIL